MFGTKDDLQMVFSHEIAHACNHLKGRYRRKHGSEWKKIAREFGIKNPTKISYVSDYLVEVLWSNNEL